MLKIFSELRLKNAVRHKYMHKKEYIIIIIIVINIIHAQ